MKSIGKAIGKAAASLTPWGAKRARATRRLGKALYSAENMDLAGRERTRAEALAALADGADPNLFNELLPGRLKMGREGSALMLAIENGDETVARELLRRGARVGGAIGKRGRMETASSLALTAAMSPKEGCLRALLEAGCPPGAREEGSGLEPLHVAASLGRAGCVAALLEAGARWEARDEGGNTPLHSAALMGSWEACEALIKAGADLGAINKSGETALMLTESKSEDPLGGMLGQGRSRCREGLLAEQERQELLSELGAGAQRGRESRI